ncbi:2-phosphoxylose phosphatase 1 [Toxorhynchites rutilus septentrionalis]|uniref:2-phosphoxylose phosphatase 1 n=1 Tax=Toxorhynchites rutilus septentrionalis TaxID=329112 RepID=UPI002478F18B|nr:2-phosphoxylose phosphatase 1 [Toxorhynchites rutilus septentrionalis]
MLLREIARFSLQHRTLYCYLILSIWIFLLIAGMYKYIGSMENSYSILGSKSFFHRQQQLLLEEQERIRAKKMNDIDCNHPPMIGLGEEGGVLDGWSLQGVLLLIRHGDRGPMTHVRDIDSVDCSYAGDTVQAKYNHYITNSSSTTAGHWMKTGPFHGFPLLPASPKACLLGQLTQKGVAQLLRIGEVIRQAYVHPLSLNARPTVHTKTTTFNSTSDTSSQINFNTDDIVVYATRYRRTFQSAMALMFGIIPPEKWQALQIQESHSLSFCFTDCACPQADNLKKQIDKESKLSLTAHPAVGAIVQWMAVTMLQNQPFDGQVSPLEIRDAILTHICHDAPLPCRKISLKPREQRMSSSSSTQDPQDVINIDQDDNTVLTNQNQPNTEEPSDASQTGVQEPEIEGCVERSHVTALMSYTQWAGSKEWRSVKMRQQGLLRSYGFLRNIVGYMLKMISGDKVKFVLYSGHDKTMEYVMAALGLTTDRPFIPYASRMAFEVYKSDKDTQYYFRLLYNGNDVTSTIGVCEGGKSLSVPRGIRGDRAKLCPIENIIRFLHDDYFLPLNATNFKDACLAQNDF